MREVVAPTVPASSKTYSILRSKVQDTFTKALKRIESEKVRTYWKTGRLIASHILQSKGRTGYGDRVVERLAEDLSIEKTVLNRTIQFYRQFPKLGDANVARGQHLSWSQYRTLLPVTDDRKRLDLARRAQTQGWTQPQLLEEVRKLSNRPVPQGNVPSGTGFKKLKRPSIEYLFYYRIIEEVMLGSKKPRRFIDLGFNARIEVERFDLANDNKFPLRDASAARQLGNIRAGEVVRSSQDSDGIYQLKKVSGVAERETFTYYASVIRIIDGDTFWMHMDLGFGIFKRVKIRLTGVDVPPLTDPRGRKAEVYVESILRSASQIIVRSRRAGKFDRYLGDVFVNEGTSYDDGVVVNSPGRIYAGRERPSDRDGISSPGPLLHLNQMLLDQGLATQNTTSH